jgi:hypothetical protein
MINEIINKKKKRKGKSFKNFLYYYGILFSFFFQIILIFNLYLTSY